MCTFASLTYTLPVYQISKILRSVRAGRTPRQAPRYGRASSLAHHRPHRSFSSNSSGHPDLSEIPRTCLLDRRGMVVDLISCLEPLRTVLCLRFWTLRRCSGWERGAEQGRKAGVSWRVWRGLLCIILSLTSLITASNILDLDQGPLHSTSSSTSQNLLVVLITVRQISFVIKYSQPLQLPSRNTINRPIS